MSACAVAWRARALKRNSALNRGSGQRRAHWTNGRVALQRLSAMRDGSAIRRELLKTSGVVHRLRAVAALAIEVGEGGDDVAVRLMDGQSGAKLLDRRVDLSPRVQGDGVDVGEAGIAGLQAGRAGELIQRRIAALQACQYEPECVVQRPTAWRMAEPRAQNALSLRIAAEQAIHVGEIDV